MVAAFHREAALKIHHQRDAQKWFEQQGNEGPLVQMGMQQVRLEGSANGEGFEEQKNIEERFLPGRTGSQTPVPENICNAFGWYAGQIPADMIGNNAHIATLLDQRPCFLVDSDMATAISKIGRWGKHQNTYRGQRISQD